MSATDIVQEQIVFAAQGRAIDGAIAYRILPDPTWACLLAGPHPMLGGEMGNNVIQALAQQAAVAGAIALSFNYAGVGASEGGPNDWPKAVSTFWRDATVPEESQWRHDTEAALDELARFDSSMPRVAIGYSFGCWTVAHAAAGRSIEALVLLSPNPARHDFAMLDDITAPVLLLHCDNEIECSAERISKWYDTLREPKQQCRIEAAEHFFRHRESDVWAAIMNFLTTRNVPGVGDLGR